MAEEVEPKKKSWAKIGCIGILGIFGLFAVLVALAPEPTPEQVAEREARQEAEAETEAVERQAEAQSAVDSALAVSSRDLAAAYEANEVRAQQAFGDRDLLVSGRVTGITLDFMDEPVVQLEGANQFLPVQADLNDQNAAVALNQGDSITLLCKEISEVISAPMLSKCELVE